MHPACGRAKAQVQSPIHAQTAHWRTHCRRRRSGREAAVPGFVDATHQRDRNGSCPPCLNARAQHRGSTCLSAPDAALGRCRRHSAVLQVPVRRHAAGALSSTRDNPAASEARRDRASLRVAAAVRLLGDPGGRLPLNVERQPPGDMRRTDSPGASGPGCAGNRADSATCSPATNRPSPRAAHAIARGCNPRRYTTRER
jgi:hypothetical protein